MGGEKKPLEISELGCADGCGRRGCWKWLGRRRNHWSAGDQRAWLCGRLRTAWVQGSGWKLVGRRSRWGLAILAEGKKPLGMSELGCADGCGRRGCKGVAGNGWGEEAAGDQQAWLRGRLRTAWLLEVGGEKKPLEISELGCAGGCGVGARECVEMGWEKKPLGMSDLACADGCGRRGCKGVPGNVWGEEAAGDAGYVRILIDKIDAKGGARE